MKMSGKNNGTLQNNNGLNLIKNNFEGELVMGNPATGGSILEISYSIGIPIGIIVFFNHFSKIKINSDPTPLQVQLRLYEQDENTAIIKNASREKKTIDVN